MITSRVHISLQTQLSEKFKLFFALLKFRLSFLVAFSAAFGYLLANQGTINWLAFWSLSVGGFLISGASIIINQILEKDLDKLMRRTEARPLPTDRVSVNEAVIYGCIVGATGFILLSVFTNSLTAFLSLISMVLYGLVYTPLKRVGSIAVWVGAVPGALPPLLGWVAATGEISKEALAIFAIQFVWQFPHFWAIAWVADEDYKKAGFRLLPVRGEKNLGSALQIMAGVLVLLPVSLLPLYLDISGLVSAGVAIVCGLLFLQPTIQLLANPSRQVALRIMFGSFLYLPIVQIAYLMDKV
jgi:protoheme IX farnesyltransferase